MSVTKKINWSKRMILKTLCELIADLCAYYFSCYPIMLMIGAMRRLRRRLKLIWVPRGVGRPQVPQEVVDLILDMKRQNWGWGALRISQELALLGIYVHKKTVARILKQNGLVPPRTRMSPISWQSFMENHEHIFQLDFTSVFDSRGVQIFILGIVDYHSRQLFSLAATANPTREWVVQQVCNSTADGFTLEAALIADYDGIFGNWLETDMQKYFGMQVYRTPYHQPWKNGRIERFFLSIKVEIFDRIDVKDDRHANILCSYYKEYYNRSRPHQSLQGAAPVPQPILRKPSSNFKYQKSRVVGGLITKFELAA